MTSPETGTKCLTDSVPGAGEIVFYTGIPNDGNFPAGTQDPACFRLEPFLIQPVKRLRNGDQVNRISGKSRIFSGSGKTGHGGQLFPEHFPHIAIGFNRCNIMKTLQKRARKDTGPRPHIQYPFPRTPGTEPVDGDQRIRRTAAEIVF